MLICKIFIRYKRFNRISIIVLMGITLSTCVEPFEAASENFESIVVINTVITNEFKNQEVRINRTFRFEEDGPLAEQGAEVKIIEGENIVHDFTETSEGVYTSNQEFAAISGREYQLQINTTDGKSYRSDKVIAPQEVVMDSVYPKRVSNNVGELGVGILVDTFDPTRNAAYYRYEFEETYSIRAPSWVPNNIKPITITEDEIIFDEIERPEEIRTCYKTNISVNINVTDTESFEEARLSGYIVNFLPAEDIRIEDRYSILVRQYLQSREANAFYKILSSFSESESLFSQIQPGFLEGNIVSENNPDDKIIGLFEVSTVTEQRIFFDRNEVIPDLSKFELDCTVITPEPSPGESRESFRRRIRSFINRGELTFFRYSANDAGSIFGFVPRVCGDCTVLGSPTAPDFWID